jgi:hypothetical protein
MTEALFPSWVLTLTKEALLQMPQVSNTGVLVAPSLLEQRFHTGKSNPRIPGATSSHVHPQSRRVTPGMQVTVPTPVQCCKRFAQG